MTRPGPGLARVLQQQVPQTRQPEKPRTERGAGSAPGFVQLLYIGLDSDPTRAPARGGRAGWESGKQQKREKARAGPGLVFGSVHSVNKRP